MSLKQRLRKGDWVRAERQGLLIEGQATHDMDLTGSAILTIQLPDTDTVTINVNRWDVSVVRENLIPYPKEAR